MRVRVVVVVRVRAVMTVLVRMLVRVRPAHAVASSVVAASAWW
jgi:hypothetical protein